MTRHWPISGFLLTLLVGFLLVTTLMLSGFAAYAHWQSQRFQAQTEAAIFQSIQSELQASYQFLDETLNAYKQRFLGIHEQALELVKEDVHGENLPALKALLQEMADVPVDIYLISPDMKVVNTTYARDQDLDFSHPALFDARLMIERARQSSRPVISPPVMEVSSRQFRIYTYSPLEESDHIFQLGFVSPELNRHFEAINERFKERSFFDAQLFFLMWDDWLLSLYPPGEKDAGKEGQLTRNYRNQASDVELFRQARDQKEAVRISNGSQPVHYLHLTDIPTDGSWEINVMAKVTMNTDAVADTDKGLLIAVAAIMFLLTLSALTVYFLLRQTLAKPLSRARRAMEHGERFPLTGAGRRIRELRLLAVHYNRMLKRTRSHIRGLDKAVRTDSLTQLANRSQLDSELAVEIKRCERYGNTFGLIFLDIDHFKWINDTHGHLEGDRMLCALSDLLRERVREADTVGRWGGEEFLVICRDSKRTEALNLAEMLRESIAESALNEKVPFTASFGVTGFEPGDSAESLVGRSDRALYQAKMEGRNRVCWV